MNIKKILALLVALIMVFSSIFVVVYYTSATEMTANNVHLVNPIDICVNENGIYIIDQVEIDGKPYTALHHISSNLETRKTYYIEGKIEKMYTEQIQFYFMQKANPDVTNDVNKILNAGFDKDNDKFLFSDPLKLNDMLDFAYENGVMYILYPTTIVRKTTSGDINVVTNLVDAKSILLVNSVLYVTYDNSFMSYSVKDGIFSPSTPKSLPTGYANMTSIDGKMYFYNDNSVVDQDGKVLFTCKEGIVSVKVYNDIMYVINRENKVVQYHYDEDKATYVVVEDAKVLGVTQVDSVVPSKYIDYTVATATGYPTNIMYEATKSNNSVSYKILGANEKFLILDYEGSDVSPYYLISYQGKFGWLEKTESNRLNAIDSNISASGITTSTAHVYSLPFLDDNGTYSFDTLNKGSKLTLLKKIVGLSETNNEWYYCSYKDGDKVKSGFVRTSMVTDYKDTVKGNEVVGRYTVNPKLTNQLEVYSNKDLTSVTLDENNNPLTLKAGANVVVIEMTDTYAQIQVTLNDKLYYGYVNSSNLIKQGLTDYTAFGLILLLLAVLLTVFVVIMNKRKKHKQSSEYPVSEFDQTTLNNVLDNDVVKSNFDEIEKDESNVVQEIKTKKDRIDYSSIIFDDKDKK